MSTAPSSHLRSTPTKSHFSSATAMWQREDGDMTTASEHTEPGSTSREWKVPHRTTVKVVFACWAAILAEGYDVGVLGAALPGIAEDQAWNLSPLELGALGSYALVGMLFGAVIIGTLSDTLGRRTMLMLSVILFATMQLGAALAPTPELFGLFRLLGGLGMGGVIPVAAALTIEYSPPRRRSYNYGIMYSGYSLGIVLAAVVAYFLMAEVGWRPVIGIGAFGLVILPIIMAMVPESLEHLVAKGRLDAARETAGKLGIRPFHPEDFAPAGAPSEKDTASWRDVLGTIFSRRYARATVSFWISLFLGMVLVYGLNTWLPQIMRGAGYDLGSALIFLMVFSLASAVGGVVIGHLADKYGKKVILVVFYALGGVGVLMLMFPATMLVNYVFVAFAGIGSISTSLVLTAYVTDYYPSNARGAATGWALAFARVGAISGPLIGGWIGAAALGWEWNFIFFALVAAGAACAVAAIPAKTGRAA